MKKKRDLIDTRVRKLEERKRSVRMSNDELTHTIKRMSPERLTNALIGSKDVTHGEAERIRRFAKEAIKNPNSQVSDEFLNLSFVKRYMRKRESSHD